MEKRKGWILSVKEKRYAHLDAEKQFGKRIRREMFYRFFCNPWAFILGGATWFHLCSLCQYGRLAKNVPALLVCITGFLFLLLRYICVCGKCRKSSLPFICQKASVENERLTIALNDYSTDILLKDTAYYRWDRKYCYLADKKGRFYIFTCGEEEREFAKLKLSAVSPLRHCFLKTPILIGWALISLLGTALVVRSAMPFNGKLSWYLREVKNTRKMELGHDNIYEDKLSGILEDIEGKVELPEKLCLSTGFSLYFKPDGTILRFDTMLKGFDGEGNYVNSYLISYDRNKSDKIQVYMYGITNGIYEEEKDFTMLVNGLEAAPVEQTVKNWREDEYGILYYGWREFHSYDKNIIYLSGEREILDAVDTVRSYNGFDSFGGYSISVYCPGNDEIEPYRYLYLPQEEFDALKGKR